MNNAEKLAYIATRERIVNQIDQLRASGGSDSVIKRLGRFGNAFSWYPEFYPQILADINGMSDAQLMSALRTEESAMKLMAPVEGLPIHHVIANRTGGDLPLRIPADVMLDVRQMVYDKYGGFPGNSGWNLSPKGAVDERMHQGRGGRKGTVFDPALGYGGPVNPDYPILHGPGTRNIGRGLEQNTALYRGTAKEIFEALDEFIGPQVQLFQEVVNHPVTLAQREVIQRGIDVDAFERGRTYEQSGLVRAAAQEQGLDVKFAEAFDQKPDFSGANATIITDPEQVQDQMRRFENRLMRRRALTGLAMAGVAAPAFLGTAASAAETTERYQLAQETGDMADELQAGLSAVSLAGDVASYFPPAAPIGEAVSTTADVANIGIDYYREDPERAKQFARETLSKAVPKPPMSETIGRIPQAVEAVKRGGRVQFDVGGVKFTAPELGISELLGMN